MSEFSGDFAVLASLFGALFLGVVIFTEDKAAHAIAWVSLGAAFTFLITSTWLERAAIVRFLEGLFS